jgi:hypothetical protein
MLHLTLISLLLASHSWQATKEREVSVSFFEINHVHSAETGEHQYTQVVYWNWDSEYRRHNVLAWHIAQELSHYPTRQSGQWIVRREMPSGRIAVLRSKFCVETWTTNDPERDNGKLLHQSFRLKMR